MIDTTIPNLPRFQWPKAVPVLDAEQRRISDDFMRHWHDILPNKYGAIERFNHGYPLRFLPEQERFKPLEIGAGTGTHLAFQNLNRQDYTCVDLRQNMAHATQYRFLHVPPPARHHT